MEDRDRSERHRQMAEAEQIVQSAGGVLDDATRQVMGRYVDGKVGLAHVADALEAFWWRVGGHD